MSKKSILAIVLAVMMLAGVFAACNNQNQPSPTPTATPEPTAAPSVEPTPEEWHSPLSADDPVTISFLWPLAKYPNNTIDTRLGQELKNRTGIDFSFILTTGNADEYHNLLVASRDFPDVITVNPASIEMYIDAQCILPLEDLYMDNAPFTYSVWASEENGNLIQSWKNQGGSDTLYLTGMSMSCLLPGTTPIVDYLNNYQGAESDWASYFLYPEVTQLTSAKPQTLSDVYDLYVAYQDQFGGDGVHFATAVYSDLAAGLVQVGAQLGGYRKTRFSDLVMMPDGPLVDPFTTDAAKQYLLFLNRCYREGLMDPESPLQGSDEVLIKASNGNIFGYTADWWLEYNANNTMANTESLADHRFVSAQIKLDDTVEQTWQNNKATVGWRPVVLTEDFERPEKFVQFVEWFYREPGAQMLMGWGFEGEDYVMNADGQPDLTADLANNKLTADYYRDDLGLSANGNAPWAWAMLPLPERTIEGYVGVNANANFRRAPTELSAIDQAIADAGWSPNGQTAGMHWKDPTLLGVLLDADKKAMWTVSRSLLNDEVMNIIMAATEADAIAAYYQAIATHESAGAPEYVEYMNGMYDQYSSK